jgi:tetratricopeptide (TPR) repeat protein/predicted Ser/Thr protein kinase
LRKAVAHNRLVAIVERVDEVVGESAGELRAARPRVDQLDMAHVRVRAEQLLFGSATPATVGRYVLLGQSADGGMGVVHAAYDPELHRKVALKILHPQHQHEHARERLIAEARALAKLDHPNIVKLHDVVNYGDHVVLVMEWVEGETLAAWQRAKQRPWREVLPVYVQAAQGLAAAHSVGVIHRDFKPANAILGADGRVRVLDFGLARPEASTNNVRTTDGARRGAGAGSVDDAWPADLTATGAVVGTLAYAAPEQLEGNAATPASDQFSFAVSLHYAVEGVAPFSGDDIALRCAAICAGKPALANDRRAVPVWLRTVLARALSASAGRRHPSMQAVIAALTRPRGWRRWRISAALGALTAIAAVAIATGQAASDRLAPCDGGVGDIDPVWNPAVRGRVGAAFDGIQAPWVDQTRDRVLHGLDGYRARWIDLHRDACLAHRRGAQSEVLLDRRMLCLQKHLIDLQSAVSVVSQIDRSAAAQAVDVVARMPALDECTNLERLQSQSRPPPTTVQGAVTSVRERLSQASALDRIGRNAEAIGLATQAFGDAERTGYAPLIADAALARGRMLLSSGALTPATAALSRALEIGLRERDLTVAVEAGARKIFTEGQLNADLAAQKRDASFLLPLSFGLPGDHFARPLLLNNLGSAYLVAGEREQALRYFQEAHDVLEGVRDPDPELTCVDLNLARVTPNASLREALARASWIRLRTVFGDANLATLDALRTYAHLIEDPTRSLPLLAQACDGYTASHPELVDARVYCDGYRAFLTEQRGDRDGALQIYDGIIALASDSTDEDASARATLATGSAALLRGDLPGASLAWRRVAESDARSPHWWVRARAAQAEVGLGTVARLLNHASEAAAHLQHAVRTYREVAALSEDTEYRMRLAVAERAADLRPAHPGLRSDQ